MRARPTACGRKSRRTITAIFLSLTCCRSLSTKNGRPRSPNLPELPEARRARLTSEYGITEYDAQVLTVSKALADQFEAAAKAAKNPKRVANLVQSKLMGRLKAKGIEVDRPRFR